MAEITKGMFDLIEDAIVQALEDFSTVQEIIDPDYGFDVSQGRSRPINSLPKPLVNVRISDLNPEDPGSRTYQQESVTYNVDLIVKGTEQTGATPIASDEVAYARLKYLVERLKYPLFALVNADFGFDPGLIARKSWPRCQFFTEEQKEALEQIADASWTFTVEYAWQPEDQTFVDLEKLSVSDSLKERWSALYQY